MMNSAVMAWPRTIALACTLIAVADPAQAKWDFSAINQGNWYVGADGERFQIENAGDDATVEAIQVHGGYRFNQHISVESRIGFGVAKDQLGADRTIEIDSYYGLYAIGSAPLGNWIDLYGLVGLTDLSLEQSKNGRSNTFSDTDYSYGVGARLKTNGPWSFSIEGTQWIKQDGYDASGLGLGVHYDF